ncbi:MAG: hypothetical protein H6Q86_6095 [candidate division NC10 bacterium]|nr:hypothetical protein [candidate division NC10 bacterium]
MVTVAQNDREVSFDLLKKYGMKWAVVAALVIDLGRRGIRVPSDVNEELKVARMKIMSGCFSPCEIACAFGKLEGQLIALGASLGEDYLRPWSDLLGQAMEGRIDPGRVSEIPALEPIANDCKWLACRCGETATLPEKIRPEEGAACS